VLRGTRLAAGIAEQVRSRREMRTRTRLTPIMIQAMRWIPLTLV
jgi:hypothetical protein